MRRFSHLRSLIPVKTAFLRPFPADLRHRSGSHYRRVGGSSGSSSSSFDRMELFVDCLLLFLVAVGIHRIVNIPILRPGEFDWLECWFHVPPHVIYLLREPVAWRLGSEPGVDSPGPPHPFDSERLGVHALKLLTKLIR